MNYFFTNIFFEIFNEKPIAIKCTTAPRIAPIIKSSKTIHTRKNTTNEGTETIIAIILPFKIISLVDSLDDLPSDNSKIFNKW